MKRLYSLISIEDTHQKLQDAIAELELCNIIGAEMSDKIELQREINVLESKYANMLKHQYKKSTKK